MCIVPRVVCVVMSMRVTHPRDPLCGASSVSLPHTEEEVAPLDAATFARLHALGLLGTSKPGGPIAETVMEMLAQSGRALMIEREDDGADHMARTLAVLAAPVLEDVVFAEQIPHELGGAASDGRRVLFAWSRGERFEVELDPAETWEDLPAVIGLLNVLARARSSGVRFVFRDEGDADEVVAGLERSLRAAIAEGLITIELDVPVAAETAGGGILRALRGSPPP